VPGVYQPELIRDLPAYHNTCRPIWICHLGLVTIETFATNVFTTMWKERAYGFTLSLPVLLTKSLSFKVISEGREI